jgi:hypothetical protein
MGDFEIVIARSDEKGEGYAAISCNILNIQL